MKINSKDLFNYINNLKPTDKIKFKVYYDDCYVTDILWDGENFNWESGRFTSGAFFNSLYDFEIIEEEKEIKKIGKIYDGFTDSYYDTCLVKIAQKVDEIIDAVNKLKVDD